MGEDPFQSSAREDTDRLPLPGLTERLGRGRIAIQARRLRALAERPDLLYPNADEREAAVGYHSADATIEAQQAHRRRTAESILDSDAHPFDVTLVAGATDKDRELATAVRAFMTDNWMDRTYPVLRNIAVHVWPDLVAVVFALPPGRRAAAIENHPDISGAVSKAGQERLDAIADAVRTLATMTADHVVPDELPEEYVRLREQTLRRSLGMPFDLEADQVEAVQRAEQVTELVLVEARDAFDAADHARRYDRWRSEQP